mgnify:FL=1
MGVSKSPCYVYLLALTASLGGYTTGLYFTVFNATLLELERALPSQITPHVEGLIQSFIPLGGLISGLLSGLLAESLGRRKGLIVVDLLSIIGCILTILKSTPIVWLFLLGRLICGLTVGLNWTIVTLYIRETAPVNMSGRMGSFFKVLFAFGILTNYAMSFMLPKDDSPSDLWRVLFAFPALVSFIRASLLLFVFPLDTPKYYILKENHEAAYEALRRIYKEEYVNTIFEKEKKAPRFTEVKDYFRGRFTTQFKLACMLIAIFQFTGVNLVTFYSTKMFFSGGRTEATYLREFNLMIGLIRMLCALCAGPLADKIGRRWLFIIGDALITIALFLLGLLSQLHQHGGVKFFLLFYVVINGFTFATILPVYMAEVLPLPGCGYAVSFENLLVFLVIYAFPLFVNLMGLQTVFYLCFFCGVGGFVYIYSRVKETKGKKDSEIYNEFNADGANFGLLDDDMNETPTSKGRSASDDRDEIYSYSKILS